MENEEIDYLQPTKFWQLETLPQLWAHLSDEVDEFLSAILPIVKKSTMAGRVYTDEELYEAAMELVDIQVMCNTIAMKIDELPVKMSELPDRYMNCPLFVDQIMLLLETKAWASSEARAIIRGSQCYSGPLHAALIKTVFAAESVLRRMIYSEEKLVNVRKLVYEKNKKRGYYEL